MLNFQLLNFLGVSFPSLAILEGKGEFALKLLKHFIIYAAKFIYDLAKGEHNLDSVSDEVKRSSFLQGCIKIFGLNLCCNINIILKIILLILKLFLEKTDRERPKKSTGKTGKRNWSSAKLLLLIIYPGYNWSKERKLWQVKLLKSNCVTVPLSE